MGLEVLDIVLQTEAAFGVSIPDEDAERLETVGQFCDYVAAALGLSDSDKCLSGVVFYRLRRAFGERLGVKRGDFVPDSRLTGLLPWLDRRAVWHDLAKASDLEFPRLVRPRLIEIAMPLGALGFFIAAIVSKNWLYASGIVAFPVAVYYLSAPLAFFVPRDMITVRSAVTRLVPLNIKKLAEHEQAWNTDEIYETVVGIVVNTLKIDPKLVTREARFVRDLGAG